MIKPKFTLHHGWGFGSSVWSGWVQDLEPEFEVDNLDRGYFGGHEPSPRKNMSLCEDVSGPVVNLRVTVAHSLGLHLLTNEILENTDMLVCIGAFSDFLPAGDRLARRTLHRMQSRFSEAPADVLADFHYRSFDTPGLGLISPPLMRDESNWNLELLADDLSMLESAKLDYSNIARIPHILLLHGMSDIIVPPSRAYELQRYLPQSRLILHNSANHALPFLHMDWCLQHIMCFVDEIESQSHEIESLQTPVKFKGMKALVGALDS